MILKIVELLALTGVSAVSDLKHGKVYNKVVCTFILLGLLTNIIFSGIAGIGDSIIGMIIPILGLFIMYALRLLGAGDVKLFAAVGAIMGKTFIIENMVFAVITNGVIALVLIFIRKNGIKRIKYFFGYIKACFLVRRILPYTQIQKKDDGKFSFAVGIFIGTIFQLGYIYIN